MGLSTWNWNNITPAEERHRDSNNRETTIHVLTSSNTGETRGSAATFSLCPSPLEQPRQKFPSFPPYQPHHSLTSFPGGAARCNIFAAGRRESGKHGPALPIDTAVWHRHYEIPVSPVRRTRAWWINTSRGIPVSKSTGVLREDQVVRERERDWALASKDSHLDEGSSRDTRNVVNVFTVDY